MPAQSLGALYRGRSAVLRFFSVALALPCAALVAVRLGSTYAQINLGRVHASHAPSFDSRLLIASSLRPCSRASFSIDLPASMASSSRASSSGVQGFRALPSPDGALVVAAALGRTSGFDPNTLIAAY